MINTEKNITENQETRNVHVHVLRSELVYMKRNSYFFVLKDVIQNG